jgi:hypothetical protein
VRKIRRPTLVIEYPKGAEALRAPFARRPRGQRIKQLQAIADRHIKDYGLLEAA